jgi:hypothetical protein
MFFKEKTINYLFINPNFIEIVIFDAKCSVLFSKTQEVNCFNDFLILTDAKILKYHLTQIIQNAEQKLQTLLKDFAIVIDGLKIECREIEITREFLRVKKISKHDITIFEQKAREVVFESDISVF